MRKKRQPLHFVGLNCCKPGIFENKKLRQTTNPADVTCRDCLNYMSKFAKEHRAQLLKARMKRKNKEG